MLRVMQPLPDLITSGEVAQMLGVDRSTNARWDESGTLKPYITLPSGQRRYRRIDIEALFPTANNSGTGA